MRRMGRSLALAAVILGMAGVAGAATMNFEDVIDYSGSGTDSGRTYLQVSSSVGATLSYAITHVATFAPSADYLTEASLVISHKGNDNRSLAAANSNHPAELWFLLQDDQVQIGQLAKSENNWVDQEFSLPQSILGQVQGMEWTLVLYLGETTSGVDLLWLDKSILRGAYSYTESTVLPPPPGDDRIQVTAVPEPRSMLLLGTGLLTLAGTIRRRAQTA